MINFKTTNTKMLPSMADKAELHIFDFIATLQIFTTLPKQRVLISLLLNYAIVAPTTQSDKQ